MEKIFDSEGKHNIDKVIANLFIGSQAKMWYRNDWEPCKAEHINSARSGRHEIYNQWFRRWHWRLAGEQLIFSHIDYRNHEDPASGIRYGFNRVRQLLIAGEEDAGGDIYGCTVKLASKMTYTPGMCLFLRDTGHSIYAERPRYLAVQIANFLA